jgi:hypothetical protein
MQIIVVGQDERMLATTLKHYARFLPAVDERNLRLLDEFAD